MSKLLQKANEDMQDSQGWVDFYVSENASQATGFYSDFLKQCVATSGGKIHTKNWKGGRQI